MERFRKRPTFSQQVAHPVDDQSRQAPDLLAIVKDQPPHGLKVVTGRCKSGDLDELGKDFALYGLFLVCSDGSTGAQEVFHLFRVEKPIPSDRRALLWGHIFVRHGSMRTYGHTMTAVNAEFISIVSGGRDWVLILEFHDPKGALSDTQTVLLAFFLICYK